MSAGSDPVVIVSAARTAIGERPDPSAPDPSPGQLRREPGLRDGEGGGGPAGRALRGPVSRASPVAPPLTLRLAACRRATALPGSPIGCLWDALSFLIRDWSALPSTIGHAVVVGPGARGLSRGSGQALALSPRSPSLVPTRR